MRYLFVFTAILGLSLPVGAQQTGDAFRDYTINGTGAGTTSPAPLCSGVPGAFTQTYTTTDPGAPVIWATAAAIVIGAFVTPTNSLDLDPFSLTFLGAGGPGIPGGFFFTDPAGTWTSSTSAGGILAGITIPLQMAHLAASSPDGFWLSQAHEASFLASSIFPVVDIGAGDDTSTLMPLGFLYTHYGVVYPDIFIGSNGFITFGAPDADFTESVAEFLAGPPRIALYWDDLTPPSGGSVSFFTDGVGIAEVSFLGVPEFFATGSNTFDAILDTFAGTVTVSYLGMTSLDGLVGMGPGLGLDPVGTPIDLTLGPNVIPQGVAGPTAAFELFDGLAAVNDLPCVTITWALDGTGAPIAQL